MTTAQKPYVDNTDVYINFPTGRLTLTEVQQIFTTIPFELDLIDRTDHFAWFSNKPNREHKRSVDQVGETVQQCHPARVLPHVMGIINAFKDGTKDVVRVPLFMNGHRCLIQYYALRDVDGTYLGTIEFTGSVEDILGFYEKGAWSENTPNASAAPAAPSASGTVDATSGASQTSGPADSAPVADATTNFGAPAAEQPEPFAPDATSGASDTDYPSAQETSAATSTVTPVASSPFAPVAPSAPPVETQPTVQSESPFAAPTSPLPDATSGASETPSVTPSTEPAQSAPTVPVESQSPAPAEEADTPDATSGASATGM
ncbi:MAG: PAS domain-containing protein [Bifidobacteriaceae bacterium]|jgi:hypothetical protein|nr:PAS domain-containing protein [Bifidobacteriaceae bacterium]